MRSTFGILVIIVAAALGVQPAAAQQNPFVGTWLANLPGMSITLVMGPDMSYTERVAGMTAMTLQSGDYVMSAPSVLSFNVVDWQPKTMPIYHPIGTSGGYYTQQVMAKPPGGTYRYQFNGANSFTIQDVNFHGTATFVRQ